MAKTDIEDAFHFIPLDPLYYHLISFIWQEKFYFDPVLPMEASSSYISMQDLANFPNLASGINVPIATVKSSKLEVEDLDLIL